MRNPHLIPLSLAALAAPLSAQISSGAYTGPSNVFFAMDNLVQINSMNTTNQVSIASDDCILAFSPGSPQRFASVYTDFNTWSAYFGDEDNDGNYAENIIGSIDALWVPDAAPASPSIHQMYFSIQTPVDPAGTLAATVSDGDMVRIRRDGSLETFISQSQIISATGGSSLNVDVNGFAVDESNGDLYMTFTATVAVGITPLDDGGIMRIPGSAYTLSGGVVTAVVPGSGEIVLTENDTDAIFINAGFPDGVTDLTGIEISPVGGNYTSPDTGFTVPNLWLLDDDTSDESVVDTFGMGQIATVNGLDLTAGPNMGLAPLDPFGGTNDNPFAIAFQDLDPTNSTPMIVDQFPGAFTTPGTVTVDVGHATPTGSVFLLLEIADGTPLGAFTPRLGNISLLSPFVLASTSWDVFFTPTSVATIPLVADPEGYASLTLPLPPFMGNILLVYQAFDFATFQFSAPCLTEAN